MTPEQLKEMADMELRVTEPDPMTQDNEALGFISIRSEETHRVIDEVNAILRAQAARIAELEALVAAEFDMLDSTWKARAEAAEAEVARLREALGDALDAWDTHNETGDMMDGYWVSDTRAALAKKEAGE